MITTTYNSNPITLPSLPAVRINTRVFRGAINYMRSLTKKIVLNKYVGAFLTVWSGPIE